MAEFDGWARRRIGDDELSLLFKVAQVATGGKKNEKKHKREGLRFSDFEFGRKKRSRGEDRDDKGRYILQPVLKNKNK